MLRLIDFQAINLALGFTPKQANGGGFELNYQDSFVKTVSLGMGKLKINFKTKNVFIHRDRKIVHMIEDLAPYNLALTKNASEILNK